MTNQKGGEGPDISSASNTKVSQNSFGVNRYSMQDGEKRKRPASCVAERKSDTANRLNGFERPKPNEGYALKSGVSNTICNSSEKVKGEESLRSFC